MEVDKKLSEQQSANIAQLQEELFRMNQSYDELQKILEQTQDKINRQSNHPHTGTVEPPFCAGQSSPEGTAPTPQCDSTASRPTDHFNIASPDDDTASCSSSVRSPTQQGKEAPSLELGRWPDARPFRHWMVATRKEIAAKSARPEAAMRLILEVSSLSADFETFMYSEFIFSHDNEEGFETF